MLINITKYLYMFPVQFCSDS